jgi:hypothetical protein
MADEGMTIREAQANRVCVLCEREAISFKTALHCKAYQKYALCQDCQDGVVIDGPN